MQVFRCGVAVNLFLSYGESNYDRQTLEHLKFQGERRSSAIDLFVLVAPLMAHNVADNFRRVAAIEIKMVLHVMATAVKRVFGAFIPEGDVNHVPHLAPEFPAVLSVCAFPQAREKILAALRAHFVNVIEKTQFDQATMYRHLSD